MAFESDKLEKHISKKEVLNSFGLVRDLFEYARGGLSEDSDFFDYTDPDFSNGESQDLPLPDKLSPLVADYPGKYFVVHFEDRFGSQYAVGTRYREVLLSTAVRRYLSDEKLREINFQEYEASEGKGNVFFMTVSERVNERSRTDLNKAREGELNAPSGSAEITYEVNVVGEKRMSESHFSRLDEGMFQWRGSDKPVRWVRNLDTESQQENHFTMTYKDTYIIGRDERGDTEERAQVKIHITGQGGLESSILIEIGLGAPESAEILFEDKENSIKVLLHSPKGMKAFASQMEIIKQDPNYAFLFERPINKAKLIATVQSRVNMLRDDWDKHQPVFGTQKLDNNPLKAIKE